MKNGIVKNKDKNNIINNNNGIALVTVILVIAILGILAAVAIETTGTDILNAGNYTRSEQTLDIGNSAINLVFSQIGSGSITYGISGVPIQNEVYLNGSIIPGLQTLTPSDLTVSISNFQQCNSRYPHYGYEYTGTYGMLPGNSGYMYIGTIYVIAQKTCFANEQGSTKTLGATFDYGPISQQPVPTEY